MTGIRDAPAAEKEEDDAPCGCKVGETSRKYGVADVVDELDRLWTDDGDDRHSVRDLTSRYNRAILSSAMAGAAMVPADTDVEMTYERLTDHESSGIRTQIKKRLAQEGVAIDDVQSDFVSHQTIYHHLTNCRDVSFESDTDATDRVDDERERIQALEERTSVVAKDKLDRLDENDHLNAGDVSVLVSVQVFCNDCLTGYPLDEFLDHGGCDC